MTVPSAEQLILAVKHFLESDVLPQLEHRTAFHARVASNVLGIVARELAQRPDTASENSAALLCADIRAGKTTEETPGVLDHLLQATRAQVAIDNPKYSTYVRMQMP
jgi:Domain of unknown function (DUF6285)